jgi:hypothetical protein
MIIVQTIHQRVKAGKAGKAQISQREVLHILAEH